MRLAHLMLLLALVAILGCAANRNSLDAASLSAAQKQAVADRVRHFVLEVSHDLTQEGPAAWRTHFEDSPSFFMIADGKMQFPDSASATRGIEALTHSIKHIDLQWGDDLRIDPLTPDFAVVATSYREVLTDAAGHQIISTGFFTGVAENLKGQWQFRNAHWSSAAPPASGGR